ncbi:MAG: hypothetical protein HN742_10950 [Lentisphaerae bacterium]|nr:hypothetical protein [Lentisphaerota bacterium]MBT4819006.1 hypothetical protein [Lentisphaerota bacterium]MBT5607263.1 hypothetical protein [Lentisphaerota bacterium]MBT7058808.1 hypothetical protein [Lentisphaerota bacterium]MBT7842382.1 hypothetical protein [Lentisphaerota bacterium]
MPTANTLRPFVTAALITSTFGMPAACVAKGRSAEAGRMPPEQFLEHVRQPFRQNAWARMGGKVTRSDASGKTKADLRVAILFATDTTDARLILNDENLYLLHQTYSSETGVPKAKFTLPENESGTTLKQLGVRTSDVTFSFLSWPFSREIARDSVGGKSCRVMELVHPETKERAWVWFSIAYFFPLRVHWFHDGADAPWRKLELKGLKRHAEGLWFIKNLQLKGEGWKTQVNFEDAELGLSAKRRPPTDLLTDTPKKPAPPKAKRRILKVLGN